MDDAAALLTTLRELGEAGRIPRLPVVLAGGFGLDVHQRAVSVAEPSIILAGLATVDSGRVLHHLAALLPIGATG